MSLRQKFSPVALGVCLVVLSLAVAGLTLVSLSAVAKPAASGAAAQRQSLNDLAEHSVFTPDGTQYYCEPGSATLRLLGPGGVELRTLTVTDADGGKVAVERLFFDKARGQLMAISGADLYAVDATGRATVTPLPATAQNDRNYQRLATRQKALGSDAARAAKRKGSAIVERIRRGESVSAEEQAFIREYERQNAAARPGTSGALDSEDHEVGCNCTAPPYESGSLDRAIPDNSGNGFCAPQGGTADTITLPAGAGTIADVNIAVNIAHSGIGDLVIDVTHNGTTVLLFSRLYLGCDDLHAVFGTAVDDDTRTLCPEPGCQPLIDFWHCGNMDLSVFDGMDAAGDWIIRVADHGILGTGSLSDWSVCITPAEVRTPPVCDCPEAGYGTGPINVSIPDGGGVSVCETAGGIASTIQVPAGTGLLSDVNVTVNINHTWVGDLVISLEHNATVVRLLTHQPSNLGEDCDNLATVFDDEGSAWVAGDCPHSGCTQPFDPSECGSHLLAAFNGMLADGDWTLRVADVAGGDLGTLLDWSLCFNAPDPPVCGTCPVDVNSSGVIDLPIYDGVAPDYCSPAGGTTHTILVPAGSGLVQDVNIGLNITHSLIGDLVIDVTHNGTTVRLRSVDPLDEFCADYDNLVFDDEGTAYDAALCPHTGCYQTTDPGGCGGGGLLSDFDGMLAEGEWTIRVADYFLDRSGTLTEWNLCLTTTPVGGFVSIDVETPDFSCNGGVLTPNPFTYTVHATNTGDVACNDVDVTLSAGAGPGGTAVVTTPLMTIPTLAPGQTVDLSYEVTVTPSGTAGCIAGAISVTPADCPGIIYDFFCLFDIPGCEAEPGPCGCMDVVLAVDVTGSMLGAIDNVKAELPNILTQAATASGGDVRFALVTFRDQVSTLNPFTFNTAAITASINSLTATGGAGEPEPSDEALREIITQDALCTDGSEFNGTFRASCVKVVVLITDARPGGCDDVYTLGVDDVNAHQRALDALAQGILVSAVNVPTNPPYQPEIVPIMQDYAATSGGAYIITNADGSGTGAAIASILENCGGETGQPDDCLPEGPDCNGQAPLIYTSLSGMIDDAVVALSGDSLRLDWRPVNDAEFYQVYMGGMGDDPANYAPIGAAFDTTFFVPTEVMAAAPTQRVVSYYVQAKRAEQRLVGSNLACWPLDENGGPLVEDFAQNHDGTIHGADWVPSAPGHSCLRFAYGDYVDLLNDVQFYGQPLQVDACITIPSYPTIPTGSFYIFSCHRYATWFQGFGLRIDVNGRLLSEVWNQNTQSWNTLWAPPSMQVPLGVPFMVTAVINGNQSLLLLNGDVVAAGVQDYVSISNGFHMTIGAHNYNDGRYQYHMRGDIHWLKVSQIVPEP